MHFQGSQWGTREHGRFTINLGATQPEIYSLWTGRAFPSNPGSALWPISARIGSFVDGKDLWWSVDRLTDTEILAHEILNIVELHVLPWFDRFNTLSDLDSALAGMEKFGDVPGVHMAQVPLIRAIIANRLGQRAAAKQLIACAASESEGKPFGKTVEKISSRLGINVA